MRKIYRTSRFKKDVKRVKKRDYPIEELKKVISILAEGKPLSRNRYRPHKLSGDYDGFWECHIKSDWLLIWYINENADLVLVRTGTHSDIFE